MTANCEKCKKPVSEKVEAFCLSKNQPMKCYVCQQEEKEGSPKPEQKTAPSPDIAPNKDDLISRQCAWRGACDLLAGTKHDPEQLRQAVEFGYNWITRNGGKQ